MKQQFKRFLTAILLATLMLTGCASETSTKSEPKTNEVAKEKKTENKNKEENKKTQTAQQKTPNKETPAPVTTTPTTSFSLASIPAYSGKPYVAVNDNKPFFPNNLSNKPFESYSNLDQLGRCGVATACITKALMPTTKRGSIATVKPSGWQTVRYEVVGKGSSGYLYNRCHLIGYQLTGENANVKNLITGTRSLKIWLPTISKKQINLSTTVSHLSLMAIILWLLVFLWKRSPLLIMVLQFSSTSSVIMYSQV